MYLALELTITATVSQCYTTSVTHISSLRFLSPYILPLCPKSEKLPFVCGCHICIYLLCWTTQHIFILPLLLHIWYLWYHLVILSIISSFSRPNIPSDSSISTEYLSNVRLYVITLTSCLIFTVPLWSAFCLFNFSDDIKSRLFLPLPPMCR